MSPGNCHNRIVELRDHLLLLGVGGSGSAILESGEHVWDGFPMNNDLDLTVPYELLSSLSDDDSVILLTHAPASCLPSSRQQKSLDDTPILCGSGKLTFFFHQLLRSVCDYSTLSPRLTFLCIFMVTTIEELDHPWSPRTM